jgi:phosphonate transport system substrate-binding protein
VRAPNTRTPTAAVLLLLIVGLACAATAVAEPLEGEASADSVGVPDTRAETIVIGKVSDNPRKHYDYLKPMADYVAARMSDLGVTRAEVLMAPSNEAMIEHLKAGRVDWVTETPFSAVAFEEEADATLLLRKWKKGVPVYRAVFAVRTDSDITKLEDLVGHAIAFEDEGSTSAFFLPGADLIQAGLKVVRLESPRDSVPTDAVGFVLSREEINSSVWLHRGLVDAAVFSDGDWEIEDHVPAECREVMYIIHTTQEMDRAIEVVRGDLDPEIRDRLREILLHAHEDPEAAEALHAYQRTARFDELGPDTMERLETVRQLRRLVLEEIDL